MKSNERTMNEKKAVDYPEERLVNGNQKAKRVR